MADAIVLLVDPNGAAIRQARTTLEFEGIEVHEAYDGADALRLAEQLAPGLVVTAVGLPQRNGYELCRAVRDNPALEHTRVVLTYSAMDVFDPARAQRAGAAGSLSRPFLPSQLLDVITEVMGDGFLSGGAGAGNLTDSLLGGGPAALGGAPFLTSAESKFLEDSAEDAPRTLASDFVTSVEDLQPDGIGPADPAAAGSAAQPLLISYDPDDEANPALASGSGPHFSDAKAVRAGTAPPQLGRDRDLDARIQAAVERYLDRHLPELVARVIDELRRDQEG